jgi:hypothetical protein
MSEKFTNMCVQTNVLFSFFQLKMPPSWMIRGLRIMAISEADDLEKKNEAHLGLKLG